MSFHTPRRIALAAALGTATLATTAHADFTAPAPGSTLGPTTTFEWQDEGASAYLFRLSAVGCYKGEIVSEFGVPRTRFTVEGTQTTTKLYASVYARRSGGAYRSAGCTIYNGDLDGDGIFNELDDQPTSANALITHRDGPYTLSVLPTGRVTMLLGPRAALDAVAGGDSAALREVAKALYRFYPDSFDFLFITSARDDATVSYLGRYSGVRNDVTGIGEPLYDQSSAWGADNGKLQGVIHFPDWHSFYDGPGLHELAHRWANSLTAIPTTVGGHWGYSSGGGQLGGWAPGTLRSLGGNVYTANNGRNGSIRFGTFANGGNGLPYSNIERYLMGMLAFSELQTMQYATDPKAVGDASGNFTAASIVTVTPQALVAADGARTPAFAQSQKRFRVLNVVLTTAELSSARLAEFDQKTWRFSLAGDDGVSSYNFFEATGGTGTLVMDEGLSALREAFRPAPAVTPPEAPPLTPPPASDDQTCVIVPLDGNRAAPICF